MKKRGFTLIELLAVIVVLAIIALIATPIVMNVINDVKKGVAEASARLIGSVGRTHYVNNIMKNEEVGTIDLSKDILKYDGEQAKKGYIKFDEKGNASGKMYIGGYCVTLNTDSSVASEKSSEDECDTTIKVTYANGTPFYFNPTTGLACNKEDAVSITGTKSGCMKFYAFLTSEEDETVKLLLDHNITLIEWNRDKHGKTPDTLNSQLAYDTAGWKQIVDGVESTLTARLISATEVNQIAPNTDGIAWNADSGPAYYFHTGILEEYIGRIGTNKYAWLFDNTSGCESYGCNVEQSGNSGYWTSDYAGVGSKTAWIVDSDGDLNVNFIFLADSNGVRPVIEVNKVVFE